MILKTMTNCQHRALLPRENVSFFSFCLVEEVSLVVLGNEAILGFIIFYVVNCY